MAMTLKPVRFEEDSLKELDKLAEIEDRDVSYLIREAVDEMLEAHQWQLQESTKTLELVRSGEMETSSHSDVKTRLRAKRSKH